MQKELKELFFSNDFDINESRDLICQCLGNYDDGELFLEYRQSESFAFDDNQLKSASFDTSHGFGLRAVLEDVTGYAHSSELSLESLKRAIESVSAVGTGHSGNIAISPKSTNQILYKNINPISEIEFTAKTVLIEEINQYIRAKEPLVKQVSISISGEMQDIVIVRADGIDLKDTRPLVRLNISVVVEKNGRMENGSYGGGGRNSYDMFIDSSIWRNYADEALRQALVNLDSIPAPAGEMNVVLGSGWPGILLHEAVGHGLEGDFNRKQTSAFAGLMGERVAASGVTVIDDGTIPNRRGSLIIDDEGTPTSATTLIEDGILVGYMQDRLNARLMKAQPTGNGRRESYAHLPMPRMTNTFMKAGPYNSKEIIKSVDNGIYAVSFGGGQVDITNGKFVFSCTEAYLIENGKITAPVKGATIIGSGPDVLTRVKMVGDDLELDSGIGTCGKAGQGVPVGVGQPTILIDGITVGGTAA